MQIEKSAQIYETYKDDEKLSPVVRELSWTHNLIIFFRAKYRLHLLDKRFYNQG